MMSFVVNNSVFMSYRKYSEDTILDVLKILFKNGMNYSATEKETGIMRPTLKLWAKKYNDRLPLPKKTKPPRKKKEKVIPIEEQAVVIQDKELDFKENLIEAKERALKHLIRVIPRMQSTKSLAETLKILTDIERLGESKEGEGKDAPNLFQTIMTNIQNLEINNKSEYNGEEND